MVGKGSVNHNSRKFTTENVDPTRTHLNINYCNESIKDIYHELFNDALQRYNEKQIRADRRIDDYYEKIRSGKQEKPFHELILQIGDKETMSAESENGALASVVLGEYFRGFQARNPQLRVFSAHLHMDEATPHIHIDFVPFITGSKRGLDTRVSLKQALAAQGFKGGTRGDTEWSQWVQSEKEQLATVMERHGIEWEHKGTHEQHLSVLEYKKKERETEVAVLDEKLAEKKGELKELSARIKNMETGIKDLDKVNRMLKFDNELQLPDPPPLMSAKAYKAKFAEPLIKRLKKLLKKVVARCYDAYDSYHRVSEINGRLNRQIDALRRSNDDLAEQNDILRDRLGDYLMLRKAFGRDGISALLEQANERIQANQREKRIRSRDYER
ncbi:MAG: plasmid recombination protein [Oscillospiraceae bacterium]|nr:plasmid recombination protein [Oscillospiraceae bacterium]